MTTEPHRGFELKLISLGMKVLLSLIRAIDAQKCLIGLILVPFNDYQLLFHSLEDNETKILCQNWEKEILSLSFKKIKLYGNVQQRKGIILVSWKDYPICLWVLV